MDRARVGAAFTSISPGATVSCEASLLDDEGFGIAHLLTVVNLVDDALVAGLAVTAQNITDLLASRERLHHLATHDPLTGLLKRAGLLEAIEFALGREHPAGVVLLDLDEFKRVNDRHGHRSGDEVLVEVARRTQLLAGSAPAARLGGDEFVILFPADFVGCAGPFLAELSAAVAAPIALAGATVAVRASCGGGLAQPGDSPDRLLAAGDAFMYEAKRRQPGRVAAVVG